MSKVTFQISMSLDGFIAGPEQSVENPLGIGGEELHEWALPLQEWRSPHGLDGGVNNASSAVFEDAMSNIGAYVMGRNMFGGGPGPWGDDPWMGWWGDDPPFHVPVFVLTHHPRESIEMKGGTVFHFVTDGIDQTLGRAREAGKGTNVAIGGGAKTLQQFLKAGFVDEGWVHVVPVLLGDGVRLFDGVQGLGLKQIEVVAGEGVTHVKYRVPRQAMGQGSSPNTAGS